MKCLLLDARFFASKPKQDGKSVQLAEMLLLELATKKTIKQILEKQKFDAFFPLPLGLAIDEVHEITLEQKGFNSEITEVECGKEKIEFKLIKA